MLSVLPYLTVELGNQPNLKNNMQQGPEKPNILIFLFTIWPFARKSLLFPRYWDCQGANEIIIIKFQIISAVKWVINLSVLITLLMINGQPYPLKRFKIIN